MINVVSKNVQAASPIKARIHFSGRTCSSGCYPLACFLAMATLQPTKPHATPDLRCRFHYFNTPGRQPRFASLYRRHRRCIDCRHPEFHPRRQGDKWRARAYLLPSQILFQFPLFPYIPVAFAGSY